MRLAPAERQECQRVLELDEGWHQIRIMKSKTLPTFPMYEMLKWCDDVLGPGRVEPSQSNWLDDKDVWYSFSWYGYYSFYFKHEKDAALFALRW